MKQKNILLIEPNFPIPNKSKNKANTIHKNFVPIGLLKLGAYHKSLGHHTKLIRGNINKKSIGFYPQEILITSLFTYWSKYVWDSIIHYRNLFPRARIKLGGIYATLHKNTEEFSRKKRKYRVEVFGGLIPEAEKFFPDYNLIPEIDYHATHMMRGCIRRCSFCGTWRIEPELNYKSSKAVLDELIEIGKNKVIFYDNNILANPNIENILKSFQDLRIDNKPVIFESQSGFDGRLLEKKPHFADLIKKARFKNIRIAWDNGLDDAESISNQINLLKKAGYRANEITVFMIYNHELPLKDMIQKVKLCFKWGVQISDCRNRPLHITEDNYNPHSWRKGQTPEEYYIHPSWTDAQVRLFRKLVRIHNITMRYVYSKINVKKAWNLIKDVNEPEKLLFLYENRLGYMKSMEKWSAIHTLYKYFNLNKPPKLEIIKLDTQVQENIIMLKKLFSYHKRFDLPFPDLSNYSSQKKLNKFLRSFIKRNNIQSHDNDLVDFGIKLSGLQHDVESILL